jgi:ankyrin repeat protein
VTNASGEKQCWPAGLTPLHLAAVMGHADITAVFARHGRISPDSFVVFPGSPLDAAVVGNNPACVRIVHQFVPTSRRGFEGNTCLHMAAHCSSVATLDCLLELGVRSALAKLAHMPRSCCAGLSGL